MLDRLLPDVPDDRHPRDLSEGQRLALALALVIAPDPAVLLADEPTRGLDYPAKSALVSLLASLALASLASEGRTVIIATHDVEFVAQLAHRVIVLAQGEVVADGPAREVVCHSPVFAPQVAKVLAPAPWLTVEEVRAALEAREPAR
jgi:energy-coupling factor transport system ATP-binding protein